MPTGPSPLHAPQVTPDADAGIKIDISLEDGKIEKIVINNGKLESRDTIPAS